MAKGIRDYTAQRFEELLPELEEMGPTGFRRQVMEDVMEEFDISVASAATAYNYVLKMMREKDPDAVSGLGRNPDDSRGKVLRPDRDSRLRGNEDLRPTDPDRERNREGGRRGGLGGHGSTEGRGRVRDPERDARLRGNEDLRPTEPDRERNREVGRRGGSARTPATANRGQVRDPEHDARLRGNEDLRPNDPDREGNREGGRRGGSSGQGEPRVTNGLRDRDRDRGRDDRSGPGERINRAGGGRTRVQEPVPEEEESTDLVTVVTARDGEMIGKLSLRYAKKLVQLSSARGQTRLVIKENNGN